jgi:hypothetical protein
MACNFELGLSIVPNIIQEVLDCEKLFTMTLLHLRELGELSFLAIGVAYLFVLCQHHSLLIFSLFLLMILFPWF